MQSAIKIVIAVILFFSFTSMIRADIAPPSKLTTFYFQKNGQLLTQPVKFTIKCYGTSLVDSANKLLKISEFSETCKTYGCKLETSNIFEVYRQSTKHCDLEGEVNGEKFVAKDFLGKSMSGLNCHRADYTVSSGDKYYKETPEYKNCMDTVRKEHYPDGKNFTCHKSLAEVPKSECKGYGYITINDICYKFTSETKACISKKEGKEELCKKYLEDVTSKLAKDKKGYIFGETCEVKINIPSSISSKQQPQNTGIFIRTIDSFKCFFLKIFGKSC